MKLNHLSMIVLIVSFLISIVGCGPTLPPKLGQYDDITNSTTSTHFLSFDVDSLGIEDFTLTLVKRSTGIVKGVETCTPIERGPTININPDGTFLYETDNITINGKINDSEVNGNYATTLCGNGYHQNGNWNASYKKPLTFDLGKLTIFLKNLGFNIINGSFNQLYRYGTLNLLDRAGSDYMEIEIQKNGSSQKFLMLPENYRKDNMKELFKSVITQFYPPTVVDWVETSISEILNNNHPIGKKSEQVDKYGLSLNIGDYISLGVKPIS
jgi:hypothetical protein